MVFLRAPTNNNECCVTVSGSAVSDWVEDINMNI